MAGAAVVQPDGLAVNFLVEPGWIVVLDLREIRRRRIFSNISFFIR